MRRFLIPTAAGLALIASAGVASAQGPEHGQGGHPGGGQPGGAPHAPAPGGLTHGQGPGGGAPRIERGPRAEGPSHSEPRRAEPQARQRATEREQRGGAEQERARADRQREQNRNAEHTRERATQERATQDRRRAEENQRKSAEQPAPRREANERNERGERLGTRREEIREARTRLGTQDREKLHRAFDLERARVSNARFDFHVGHRVPRTVHLFPVPRDVIGFFPYYRDYSYFVVGDDICIVNPRTYEVVDMIDDGYWRAPLPQVAGLRLSSAQIAFVRDSIPPNFPLAGIRLRLALGGEIPDDVELHELPTIVLDRVPELGDYRFLVADEQIVIVDPRDRSIALVIDRG